MLCDHCEGYKLCSSHFPGSPRCRTLLREHGWLPAYTNADRIRAMTDEELASFLNEWASRPRAWRTEYGETKHWLKQTYPPREASNA